MTEKLKQTIEEEMMKLPKELQEAISASNWVDVTKEIGKKYLLGENEINDFQVETLLVLVGIEPGASYTSNIENEVGTSKSEAEKIATETFQRIFIPMGNHLEESVKNNLKNKNPNWQQNLDFVLSGGDYSAFIEKRANQATESATASTASAVSTTPPSLADIKANAQRANTSAGNSKMTDIRPVVQPPQGSTSGVKSKFTI